MGFFQTKDPKTGEPRLGAGVYLIICAAMIGGVILWNLRKDANDPDFMKAQKESRPQNISNITPVAKAAAEHKESADINEPTGVASEVKSTRETDLGLTPEATEDVKEETDTLDTIQNTVEILRQSQKKAEEEKAAAVAKAQAEAEAKIADLKKKSVVTATTEGTTAGTIPATLPEEQNTFEVNSNSLVIYDSSRDAKIEPQIKTAPITGFQTNNFLPRGYIFPVYILTTIQTLNQEDIVVMGVAENVIFQNKVQIPFGTRLLGSAAGSNFEDRVMVNADTILYPDGRELPISGLIKDASDLSSGVKGYYIPQPLHVQMAPYVNQFINLWTQAAAQRFSNQDNEDNTSYGVTEGGLQEVSNLITDQADRIQERLDRRFPEKVVVPIGTKAFVQLRSPLDLTLAQIGGSRENKQPVLPGFENNPFSPNGTIERTANYGVTPSLSTQMTQKPTPVPANVNTEAAQKAAAQEAQFYLDTLKQLSALEKKMSSSKTAPLVSPANKTKVNWPKGDIE